MSSCMSQDKLSKAAESARARSLQDTVVLVTSCVILSMFLNPLSLFSYLNRMIVLLQTCEGE